MTLKKRMSHVFSGTEFTVCDLSGLFCSRDSITFLGVPLYHDFFKVVGCFCLLMGFLVVKHYSDHSCLFSYVCTSPMLLLSFASFIRLQLI